MENIKINTFSIEEDSKSNHSKSSKSNSDKVKSSKSSKKRKNKKKLFVVEDSQSEISSSDSEKSIEFGSDFNEHLYVGLIDFTNDEESRKKLCRSITDDYSKHLSHYWDPFVKNEKDSHTDEALKVSWKSKTDEEIKNTHMLLDNIEKALTDWKVMNSEFYRPRTDSSKLFLNNVELISNQIFVKNQPIDKISKHLHLK